MRLQSGAIYIDGNLQGAGSDLRTDFAASTAADLAGQFVGGAFQFNGLMDDFTIYQGALSQSQVMALVPEPSSLGLLVLGGLGLLRPRRA